MGEASSPSVKLNEVYRLQSTLVGLLGNFILDLLTPLGIAEWIGYASPLWYVSPPSVKPAVSLTFVLIACIGLIADAALSCILLHQKTFSSNLLLKQGTI